MTPSFVELAERVADLPQHTQIVFNRIFVLDVVRGTLKLPSSMVPWVKSQFGQTGRVTDQSIVKITNVVTGESSIFNPLRALRPHDFSGSTGRAVSEAQIQLDDQFARPLDYTAEDLFGRVKGKYCITASNIAKYEQYHCVIVFKNHDPLDFGCNEVADYIETGWKWAQRAHDFDPLASYCLFLWNCTNRAGASIRHGHAQVVIGRGSHYVKVERMHQAAVEYREKYGTNYFDDLFDVHKDLGLAWQHGTVRTLVYLTPLKQNEAIVMSPSLTKATSAGIYRVLECFRDGLKVKSFNLGVAFPPLGDTPGWEEFPVIARMLDRGDPSNASSDIGAMEFYGANVINSDPWDTAQALIPRL